MARDKAKDDKYFNCEQEHERKYVSGLYVQQTTVYNFLVSKCNTNEIKNSTHLEVYTLIRQKLGYPIPI
ncbi:MAG: hypothetical protein V4615_15445 [Bacteroidota bacterium]